MKIIIFFSVIFLISCGSVEIRNSNKMLDLLEEITVADTITRHQIKLYKRLLRKDNSVKVLINDDEKTIRLRKMLSKNQLPFKINKI